MNAKEVVRNGLYCNFCEIAHKKGTNSVETTGVFAKTFEIQPVHCRAVSPGGPFHIYDAQTDKEIEKSVANTSILDCPIPRLAQVNEFRKKAYNREETEAHVVNHNQGIDRRVPPLQPGKIWSNLKIFRGVHE